MTVLVTDSRGWYFNGFHPQGSEVECSEATFNSAKESVGLQRKDISAKGTKSKDKDGSLQTDSKTP